MPLPTAGLRRLDCAQAPPLARRMSQGWCLSLNLAMRPKAPRVAEWEGNGRCASSFALSCRLRGRAAGRRAHHAGAILPIPARAFDRRFGRRRRTRHRGAPDGTMVSERLGRQFIVENRPGASGNLALEAVANATADGHTLALLGVNNAINASLYKRASSFCATSHRSAPSCACRW